MKTITIDLLKKEIILVELPEIIESDYSLIHGRNPEETYLSLHKRASFREPRKDEKLADGIWTPIGKPDEISEEDAIELVETLWNGFRNYSEPHDGNVGNYKRLVVETATESLISALETVIFWDVNPLGDEPEKENYKYEIIADFGYYDLETDIDKYNEDNDKWHEAQEKTFDRSRTLILVKQ